MFQSVYTMVDQISETDYIRMFSFNIVANEVKVSTGVAHGNDYINAVHVQVSN